MEELILYIISAVMGVLIGSFLNVLILRIPREEEFVRTRSHCMSCGHPLGWTDLVPIFSYVFLRGRCRYCGAKISAQYPAVEFINGALWLFLTVTRGPGVYSLLLCLLGSVLLTIAVIDWRTLEIPQGLNICILVLGAARVLTEPDLIFSCVLGFFAVSVPLAALFYATGGKAIGGGDVKLMAAAGLFLGWKNILLALVVGCILGSVIHLIRMRVQGVGKVLAMGPYLAAGILISELYGNAWLTWYFSLL